MEGYNISIKLNNKTLLGRTSDSLNISALTKESRTKDDRGAARVRVTGHDVTLNMNAIAEFSDTTSQATKLGRDEVLELSLKTGDDAVVPLTYAAEGGATYGGNAVITGLTEDSNAEDEATLGLQLRITGAFTKQA